MLVPTAAARFHAAASDTRDVDGVALLDRRLPQQPLHDGIILWKLVDEEHRDAAQTCDQYLFQHMQRAAVVPGRVEPDVPDPFGLLLSFLLPAAILARHAAIFKSEFEGFGATKDHEKIVPTLSI